MLDGNGRTDPVTRAMHAIAGVALVAMMMVVVGDVVLRAVFNIPIQGAYDVVSIALLVMTMFGIAPVVARRGEIAIDLADAILPARALRLLAIVSALTGVFLFAFFGWAMIQPAMDAWRWGERSLELGLPKWPLWVVAFIGLVGIFWAYLLQLRAALREPHDIDDPEGGLVTPFALGLSGIAVMLVLLFLRQPVWLALGVIGLFGNWMLNSLMSVKFVAGTTMFDVASSYNLSVIPLFILMGEIATGSRMSAELFNAARVLLSGLRGGLGVATLAASGAFGAICGSSVATAASMTRIAMPEMTRAGYDQGYSAASVAAGGSLGILIPPSIILVIYGSITETSVARLFAASMFPGLVLLLLYIAVALFIARRNGAAPVERSATAGERLRALKDPWQFVVLFVMTIGGIYAGIFSPTEAASVGAFGAIVLGALKRTLTFDKLIHAIKASVAVSCALFMIIIGATLFANFVVQTRLPDTLLGMAEAAELPTWVVMALIVLIYIVLGCFLEGIGMVLITVPVFLPIVTGYGFDPIWFGVLVVLLVELGLITPPVGMNLFIIRAQLPEVTMNTLYRAIIPFLLAPIVLIAILFVVPSLALWLPSVLY